MAIDFRCGQCGMKLVAKDTSAGKRTKCPKCEAILRIPGTRVVQARPTQPPRAQAPIDAVPLSDPEPDAAPGSIPLGGIEPEGLMGALPSVEAEPEMPPSPLPFTQRPRNGQQEASGRRLPSGRVIKAAVLGGVVVGAVVMVIRALVEYFMFGGAAFLPGLIVLLPMAAVMGAILGAGVGLVMAFSESLLACIAVSAILAAGIQLLIYQLGGLGEHYNWVWDNVRAGIWGAVQGWLIATSASGAIARPDG